MLILRIVVFFGALWMLAFPALAQEKGRFTLHQGTVTNQADPVTLLLDTATGGTWMLGPNGYKRIVFVNLRGDTLYLPHPTTLEGASRKLKNKPHSKR